MSNVTLFENNALANSDLFNELKTTNDVLTGGGSGSDITRRRISLNGGRFREVINGEEVNVSKEGSLNIVIVDAAKIGRQYYEGSYDPSKPAAPTCWSADTEKPSHDVPEDQRLATRCMDCPMNVKGSGQGESRACRFSQRLAVVVEGKLDKVYQLQLPATSIFGEEKNGNRPMQAYARYLNAHNTPAIAIVTEAYFDTKASTPKLFFKPVRPLEEEEFEVVRAMKDHEDTKRAITMTVAQTDGVGQKEEAPKPSLFANTPKVEEAPEEVTEEVEEPKKIVKKAAATPPKEDDDLKDIVDNWDDD